MILRQSIKNHLILLEYTFTTWILFFLFWLIADFSSDLLLESCGFMVVISIPAIYLHIEYTIRNYNEQIEINNNEIIVRRKGIVHRYLNSDINNIIEYKSAVIDTKGMALSGMERYHYTRVITKKGEEIIITCLLGWRADEKLREFTNVKHERKKSFFCTLYWK